jgi:hypothetical protein
MSGENFDSDARVVPFPVHKARKPMPEITAEHGSAIIRTLVACDMAPDAARMIVEATPLPSAEEIALEFVDFDGA